MQVQINSDNHLRLTSESSQRFSDAIADGLERFSDRITRVEAHLADENSRAKGGHDMRCTLEARVAGLQPIVATAQATALDQAVHGAIDKLVKNLGRTLDRLHDPKGRGSMAGEPS